MLLLPYIKRLSEKIQLVCRPLNIKTVLKSSTILIKLLTYIKIPTASGERKGSAYEAPCECDSAYIRKTGRQVKTCIAEHKTAVRKACTNNAMASHVWNTGHIIQWAETTVIEQVQNWYRSLKKHCTSEVLPTS